MLLYTFRYGLILSKKQEKQTAPKLSNVFGDDNASDDEDGTDWVRKALKAEGEKNKIKKQTKLDMQKALTEDPTIYQYDEVYDDMERNKKSELDKVKQQEKKPRYIENLLKAAERRKKEQEHRIERMVQKEREAEGEMYADKESFVTSAYRAKLEEFKKMEEDEAKMDRLEAIADVTKQQDMSGFYRHLYKQTVDYQDQTNDRENNKIKDMNVEQEKSGSLASETITNEATEDTATIDTTITDDRLKANIKSKKSRQYRQRMVDTYESESENEISREEPKKDETADKNIDDIKTQEPDKKKQKKDIDLVIDKDVKDIKNESSSVNDNEISQDCKKITSEIEKPVNKETPIKKDRSSIWKKRTVGPVFEAALQRYYARKAARLVAV